MVRLLRKSHWDNEKNVPKITCSSSTCDSFDPKDLLPTNTNKFYTYIQNNADLNLAFGVVVFIDPIEPF